MIVERISRKSKANEADGLIWLLRCITLLCSKKIISKGRMRVEKYQISKFVKKIKYSDDEVILYNTMNSAIVVMPKEQMNNINEMNTDELTELEQMGFFASEVIWIK